MSHDHEAKCLCAREHRPDPMEYVEHHVWPKGMGGPDTPDNLVWLCPTTHLNVHEILRRMMKQGPLSLAVLRGVEPRRVNRYAWYIARQGYAKWRMGSEVDAAVRPAPIIVNTPADPPHLH